MIPADCGLGDMTLGRVPHVVWSALRCGVLSQSTTLRAYYFASFASIGIFLPFVSPWLSALGMKGASLGIIAAMRPLTGILAPVVFGWLADTLGLRGSLLKIACLGAGLPFVILFSLSFHGASLSFAELLIAVALSSFFRVPMMTIADVSALEHKKDYGSLRLFGSLGFMAAALLAGKYMDPSRTVEFPAAVALAFFFSFGLSYRFPNRVSVPRRPTPSDALELLRRPAFLSMLVTTTIWACAHVAYDLCISLHLKDLGASPLTISLAWNIGVVAEILLMATWAKLNVRWSSERWLKLGILGTALRFAALAGTTQLSTVLWLQPLHALSFALVWMALMELVKQRAPDALLGTAQGLFSTATSVGATVGMLGSASLYELGRGRATFTVAAVVALFALVGFAAPANAETVREGEARA
jgi:PPP family 3-phenylpropionic acid transporter